MPWPTDGCCPAASPTLWAARFEPTVVADVTPAMKVAREETFGPLAPLFRFKNDMTSYV